MTSPIIWQDAFDRAAAALKNDGIPVLDIFAQHADLSRLECFVFFEIAAATSDRMAVGETLYEEEGVIGLTLHVMRGTGAIEALSLRQKLSRAFLGPASDWPPGLLYDGQQFDAPEQSAGNWTQFPLGIAYRFQILLQTG
ncbi:hypothetical protein CGLAMM_07280 [Acetobacteraceae bacterium EV16G]|uniref:AraC family transcriptional regulator n=1 Tax=Sorlinia euscelidii TaxID=3081148 RepID=A0ABU7U4N6_9PROT